MIWFGLDAALAALLVWAGARTASGMGGSVAAEAVRTSLTLEVASATLTAALTVAFSATWAPRAIAARTGCLDGAGDAATLGAEALAASSSSSASFARPKSMANGFTAGA